MKKSPAESTATPWANSVRRPWPDHRRLRTNWPRCLRRWRCAPVASFDLADPLIARVGNEDVASRVRRNAGRVAQFGGRGLVAIAAISRKRRFLPPW